MLLYFPVDNNDAGERWMQITFNETVTVAAELEVKIHDQLIEL
jgi:hypothetical protein